LTVTRHEHARDLAHPPARPPEDRTFLKRLLGTLPPIDTRLLLLTAVEIRHPQRHAGA